MGKYNKYDRNASERPYDIHPAWRGIGFLMIILVPVMSWASADVLIKEGPKNGLLLPVDLLGYPSLPQWMYTTPIINQFGYFFSSLNNFYAYAVFMIFFIILFSGILSFIYAAFYRMFGPPRYTAIDAPPSTRKVRRYKR